MSSLITLGGILLLLAFGFWWAVRTGKRLNQAEALKERVQDGNFSVWLSIILSVKVLSSLLNFSWQKFLLPFS